MLLSLPVSRKRRGQCRTSNRNSGTAARSVGRGASGGSRDLLEWT